MTIVDGNALAGVLADRLGPDATTAPLHCPGCGRDGILARTRVHVTAMGMVARCRDCDALLATVVEADGHRWVDLPGFRAASTDDG
ncbi:DUF6510 family protein [Curtobacterium luteum]|uniref:Uncharacterized protein n=1 Tax=Curtobacterium luteum TaxID=33881 RepID=A0A175RH13_9MICO|nr:DUF6510 family protein [Curtobacterium luteum]KTR03006.1 hypothetical protein NS184_14505 [Curtobacterium luteum]